jgi:hypothetical protein
MGSTLHLDNNIQGGPQCNLSAVDGPNPLLEVSTTIQPNFRQICTQMINSNTAPVQHNCLTEHTKIEM